MNSVTLRILFSSFPFRHFVGVCFYLFMSSGHVISSRLSIFPLALCQPCMFPFTRSSTNLYGSVTLSACLSRVLLDTFHAVHGFINVIHYLVVLVWLITTRMTSLRIQLQPISWCVPRFLVFLFLLFFSREEGDLGMGGGFSFVNRKNIFKNKTLLFSYICGVL